MHLDFCAFSGQILRHVHFVVDTDSKILEVVVVHAWLLIGN